MSRIRGRKYPILLPILAGVLAFAAWAPRPAHALLGADAAAIVTYFKTEVFPPVTGSFHSRLKDVIIGGGNSFAQKEGGIDLPGGSSYSSLTEYYDKVWWPRFVEVTKGDANQQAGVDALGMANDGRLANASALSLWDQMMKLQSALNNAGLASAEDVICEGPSMGQSLTVAKIIAAQMRDELLQASLSGLSGSPNAPEPKTSNGPAENAVRALDETVSAQTCDPEGNNLADKIWCPQGSKYPNRHVNVDSLLGEWSLKSDPEATANVNYAGMFIRRLFPDRAFTPIRPDLLSNPMNTQAAEVMHARDGYKAAISTFSRPFQNAFSERTEIPDLNAQLYLMEALKQAGFTDATLQKLFTGDSGVMTAAGMENIIYSVYPRDPATIVKNLSWDLPQVMRFDGINQLNHTALLYDIREQMKETNLLLGALGSMLASDKYEKIQSLTSSISVK